MSLSPTSQNALEVAAAVRSQNTLHALKKAEERLKECTDLRDIHCDKFDKICRSLGIILDEELFELTVASKVRLRVNSNYRSHLPVKGKAPEAKDMLARADQLEMGVPP